MSDSENETNDNIPHTKYKNLRFILDEENLKKLDDKSEDDIKSFLDKNNGNKKAGISGVEIRKISDVEDIQAILKKLVIETDKSLDEKNMSIRRIFEQIRDSILPNNMIIGEEFIERIPDNELNQKEKILLLMIYALHNTIFDE